MTAITEYLAEQKRLAEAAAPGKWEKRGIGYIFSEGTSPLSKEFGYDGTPIFDSFTWPEYGEANADFVIAARESVPRLVAALEAVSEAHRPVEIEPSGTICHECSFQLPNGSYFGKVTEYPCPTIRAIEAALIGSEGR